MKKVPISVIIDDPAPVISVYYEHAYRRETEDGRPLIPTYSNDLLFKFCDVIEKRGIRGKFSIVPMPGNKGDIVNGIEGVDPAAVSEWLDTVKARVLPLFTPSPEMLTHHKAVDLATGGALPMNEESFAKEQTREGLTPYIAKALSLHRDAGIPSIGVTSPWNFGSENEEEYRAAISKAVFDVTGSDVAWYFLHVITRKENVKPSLTYEEGGRVLIHLPSTVRDLMWETISSTDTSDEYVHSVADKYITADGKGGALVESLERGNFVKFNTHWQSLMSNGLGTGIRVLDLIAERVNTNLSDRVEWMDFEQIIKIVLADKDSFSV